MSARSAADVLATGTVAAEAVERVEPGASVEPAEPAEPARMRYWLVRLAISERGDRTWARAVLRTAPGREVDATGRASCRAGDLPDREIGDEVAVARALHALGDRLLERAAADITQATGEHEVPLTRRPTR